MTADKFDKKLLDKYRWIQLKFTDLNGALHSVSIPSSAWDEITVNGVGFDSSSCSGFKSVEGGDMVLMPDIDTMEKNDDSPYPSLAFYCSILEADSKKQYGRDPRSIAVRAEEYLRSTGIADTALFGPEFEFFIFDRVITENTENISMSMVELLEGNISIDDNINETGRTIRPHSGYHAAEPLDTALNIRNEISERIIDMGIDLIYHHHEVAPGQNEIEIKRYPLLKTGDITQSIKNIIKKTSGKYSKTATFMPKPMYNMPGSGMHYHQHLFKGNENLFYDSNGYGGLSPTAEYYIAGLLKHGRALLAFTNPSTNSYKRLVPGFEAPVKLFYSLANRSSAVRIPKYATSEFEKRIEFRPPDATANPYLACSAMLLAGLDGIINKIPLKENYFGPYDMNMEQASADIRDNISSCPSSLSEALEALENDRGFLLKGSVFTDDVIDAFIAYKRNELRIINERPHPFEFEIYY